MIKIKKGTKFVVCGHEELEDMGWWDDDDHYYHDDFRRCSITFKMIAECEGKILTVTGKDPLCDDFGVIKEEDLCVWYIVKENVYVWPVATFLNHTCEEGITPIFGWFICKFCGTNLKEIK